MTRYEYRLIQAPTEPPKMKGVKGAVPRYLHGLTEAMNEMGAEGWSYVRADRLPVTSRKGLLRRRDVHEELVMVFRRDRAEGGAAGAAPVHARPDHPSHWPEAPAPEAAGELSDAPAEATPAPEPLPEHRREDEPPEAPRLVKRPAFTAAPATASGERPPPRLFAGTGKLASRTGGDGPRLSARRDEGG
ncbi:hypothetical protein BCF33_1178 [Hasllibacter halocynthiae]|uniref:DUF4177 domain-containing protein n=1 Tax=Hasllibacter halocynthiae TaxID=595589 RepID=A0A2T0X9F9_9RHOB|nr:hypothetical protein [Hasllibacter halocynthiae]PRY95557.1 hypothetical protein BCF33_1178 [Hasllibacter halocynthiae]